jgi:predicted Zn-dependent protease
MRYFPQIWMAAFGIAGCAIASSASAADLSDPFKSTNNDSFFNDNSSDSLDSDFDKKMGNMFATIKKAQQSTENTKLGPMGRYVLGRNLAARVLGAYQPVDPADPRLTYLRHVAISIMQASRRSTTYIDPVVILLDAPDVINAFAAPGGFMFVTTGMLEFLKNEDELAFVLAHEVAHIELDHGLNAIKQNEGAKIFAEATADENGEGPFAAFRNFAENGFSQSLEGEADIRGAQIAAGLGYDFTQGVEVIRRLETVTARKHGTGYPANRQKRLHEGAGGAPVSAEFVEIRQRRYQIEIKK